MSESKREEKETPPFIIVGDERAINLATKQRAMVQRLNKDKS